MSEGDETTTINWKKTGMIAGGIGGVMALLTTIGLVDIEPFADEGDIKRLDQVHSAFVTESRAAHLAIIGQFTAADQEIKTRIVTEAASAKRQYRNLRLDIVRGGLFQAKLERDKLLSSGKQVPPYLKQRIERLEKKEDDIKDERRRDR